MTIQAEQRQSDSSYVQTVMRGVTLSAGTPIRPAEVSWHMVFVRHAGRVLALLVGPWTASGSVAYGAGADILWIKFKPGVFMPHLPTRRLLNAETPLPQAAGQSFWLNSSTWQLPDYENTDTFVNRLIREDVLVYDPVVSAALHHEPHDSSARTVRHRFLQATGVTQSHIRQVERAQRAAAMLRSGMSILDVVHEAGYYDQPHLTRAMTQYIGYTPAQIARAASLEQA
jgi:hypothetical protein